MLVDRVTRFANRHRRWLPLLRFLATGGLNTVFGTAIYSFLAWTGIPPKISLLLGTLISMVFNFVSYGKLAFGGKLRKENIPRFAVANVAIYVVNSQILGLLIRLGLSKYWAFIVMVPFILVTNFVVLRYFVFRDRAPAHPDINRN
jgi:putative flippase GtrA